MEFRWLTTDEARSRRVANGSLSDILALAQKLQAEGEGTVPEDQVVEMGRELGIQPDHVREALRLRRRAGQPAVTLPEPTLPPTDHNPIAAVAQVLLLVFALGMLPRAGQALADSFGTPLPFFLFALIAALATGWSARYSRLAGVAGALTVPVLLLVGAFYPFHQPSLGADAVFFSLLSLCPLGSASGRIAARARRWAERAVATRPRLSVSRH